MRKVTKQVCGAFLRHEASRCGNTRTDGTRLILHGNTIAEWRGEELWITLAGWPTSTTKDRLNGLPGVRVHQQYWLFFLNGHKWNGDWIKVSGSLSVNVQAAVDHARAKADLFA